MSTEEAFRRAAWTLPVLCLDDNLHKLQALVYDILPCAGKRCSEFATFTECTAAIVLH